MKKQPYHSPTRKSARLSSSAPRNAKPESGTRPEDAWSLIVHVVEHQPLQICFPSTETVAPLRRSSRYTTNKYSSPPPERSRSKNRSQKAFALVSSQLRRSPRFCSAPPLTLTSGENAGSKQRCRVAEIEEPGRVRKRVKLICNGEPPRRSTRLSASGGENGNAFLALPETGERSFRLRAKAESQKTKFKRTFNELSGKEKCSSIIKCDLVESAGKRKSNREVRESPKLDLLPFAESGKCLRSRIVKTQSHEEGVERDVAVINGDDKCLKTPTKKLTFDRFTHVYEKKGKTVSICFIGEPIPEEEAQKRWQWRYDLKSSKKGKGWKLK